MDSVAATSFKNHIQRSYTTIKMQDAETGSSDFSYIFYICIKRNQIARVSYTKQEWTGDAEWDWVSI